MKTRYRGFNEEKLIRASKEFEALGMKPSEVYAAMNLAGAKWRSVQRYNGRKDEAHEESGNGWKRGRWRSGRFFCPLLLDLV